jgi:hypothetical protein
MLHTVPFRDDRDALLARADALQRERDRLAAELQDESSANDELERRLANAEKELAKAQRKAGTRPSRGGPWWVAIAFVVIVVMAFLWLSNRKDAPEVAEVVSPVAYDASTPAVDAAPSPADIARRALADKDAAYRACLDRVDHLVRAAWLEYGVKQSRDRLAKWERWVDVDVETMKECARGLVLYSDREPAYGVTDDLAAQYARQLRVFATSMTALAKYRDVYEYRDDDGHRGLAVHDQIVTALEALVQTSEDFRAMYAPHHAGAMRAKVARLHSLEDNDLHYWIESLRARAVVLVDLVTLSDTSSATLEAEITLAVDAVNRADTELAGAASKKRGRTVTSRMRSLIEVAKQVRTAAGDVDGKLIDVSRRAAYRRVVKALITLTTTYDRFVEGERGRRKRHLTKP